MDNRKDNVDTQLLCKTQGRVCHHCPNHHHHHHHHPNGTCSRDERPKARFAISEEDEAPRARQVGDIRSCKSMTTMMMITMTVHGNGDHDVDESEAGRKGIPAKSLLLWNSFFSRPP